MKELRILGINVLDRIKEAGRTQETLSKHSTCIKTRWGFHELSSNSCSRNGFLMIELKGSKEQWDLLETDLNKIGGIIVKKMSFNLNF